MTFEQLEQQEYYRRKVQEIAEAANQLDIVNPGWALKINMEVLDLQCQESCVLGQSFESDGPRTGYIVGQSVLFRNHFEYGAGIFSNPRYLSAWKEEIRKRL